MAAQYTDLQPCSENNFGMKRQLLEGLAPEKHLVSTISPNTTTSNVQAGNESVLRARFEDAQFFFQEDLEQPLSDFRPRLEGITFHKSLGTMLDKSVRTVSSCLV
jgi:glycyl-tRNA synthetase beta subunit